MEIILAGSSLAGDFLERTSSTARVQQMVQLSLAPAFLLGAVGAFLSVMNQRIMWIIDRVHLLENSRFCVRGVAMLISRSTSVPQPVC
jgi:hypothetical protein